ncbi:MAG: glutaredoxin 3 [Alphaproteobacteria bacterium]|jgi:thioredoxin reductase (NADPH)|nr:glutaredoxin 3 [Alphaproteobacteria bacterium]
MKIEMYTKTVCPYCTKAKNLLHLKGIKDIIEYNIETNPELRRDFLKRTNGAKTVPQIFIDDILVGGFDNLSALDSTGELNKMLQIF